MGEYCTLIPTLRRSRWDGVGGYVKYPNAVSRADAETQIADLLGTC